MNHNYKIFGKQPVEIVVEMGLGASLSEWIPIAKILSQDFGVLLYERAGINKSEISDNERTPENIAKELYGLLEKVQHTNKIILIAHSQGGLYAQQFCRLYSDNVKGIILLDPLSAKDYEFKKCLSDKEYKQSGVDKSGTFKIMHRLAKLHMGFISKMLLKKAPPLYYYDGFDKEQINDILNSYTYVSHSATALEEYEKAHELDKIKLLMTGEGFPDIPLVLITHSSELAIKESMEFGNNSREFAFKIEEMWQAIMKEYLNFSKKSLWIQAEKSTHYIHLTQPELICNTLKNMI